MAFTDSPYLDECITSLLNQTTKSNIVIAASSNSDHINAIAKKYNIPLYNYNQGKKIAHNWNFSFSLAKTKYVTLAHEDDIYLPDYTRLSVEAAEKYSDTLITFTNYKEIFGEKTRKKNLLLHIKEMMLLLAMPFNKTLMRKSGKKAVLSFGNPICCPSVMYNKENLAGFEFADQINVVLDWDAWYQMATINGRFVYVPDIALVRRIHSSSGTTAAIKNKEKQKEDLEMFKKFWPSFLAKGITKLYSQSYRYNSDKSM